MSHLKRLAAPKTWTLHKKERTFVIKTSPGTHKIKASMPLALWLKNLELTKNAKETKAILNQIKIDNKKVTDPAFPVGYQDLLTIGNATYQIKYNTLGKLEPIKTENKEKICKITGKTTARAKTILYLHDGRTIETDNKEYNTGESIIITLPEQKIVKHIKLNTGTKIAIIGGKNIGHEGTIKQVKGDKIIYESDNKTSETTKEYAYAIP